MKGLMQVYSWLAPQVSRNQLNLLSSHDTPRFITECNGNRRLAMLGAVVQMTWVGAPSIYYGEELGMEGGADPANRAGMRWDLAQDSNEMLQHYRRLISLRNASRALQSGDPVVLLVDDQKNVSVFARVFRDDVAIVAINRSKDAQDVKVQLPTVGRGKGFVDGLTGTSIKFSRETLSIEVPPLGAIVAIPKDRATTHRL
jgi:glycosidase